MERQVFYRPVGGTVEFGERGDETIVRELDEELGVVVEVVRRLAVIENLFTYQDVMGHEVVLFYEARLVNGDHYNVEEFPRIDLAPGERRALWVPVQDFLDGKQVLYPTGILPILSSSGTVSGNQ
nr:NUDIX domain-containing protein [Anaerolineae bacterium]